MTDDRHVALRLDVVPGADPIRGVLTAQDGAAHAFVGWLGLAAEIERTLRAGDDATAPPGGSPAA
jgi:hypothetical protein